MQNSGTKNLFLFLIIIFYLGLSAFNYATIEEDSFIYFRCAQNIADGHGYVFNPGQEPIEACSSIPWLYLLAFCCKLGFNIITASKILGIFFGIFSLLLTVSITRQFCSSLPWSVLPAFLTATNLSFLMWNQMGLETALYTFLVLWLVRLCIDRKLIFYWPVPAILLLTARPEGFILLGGLILPLYFYRDQRNKIIFGAIITLFFAFVLLGLRFWYFQDFVPSPFYLKIGSDRPFSLIGFHFYFKSYYLYFIFLPMIFFIFKKKLWQAENMILLCFVFILLTWFGCSGAEERPYFRHMVPVIPLIFIYPAVAFGHNFSMQKKSRKLILTIFVLLFSLISLIGSTNYNFYYPMANPVFKNLRAFGRNPGSYFKNISNSFKQPRSMGDQRMLIGEFIKKNYQKKSKIVYDQMGQTPFAAGSAYRFIDSWGLTDKTIGACSFQQYKASPGLLSLYKTISSVLVEKYYPGARRFLTTEAVLDYIFEQSPDLILLHSFVLKFENRIPFLIATDQRFQSGYTLKYLIGKTLLFERKKLRAKPYNVPEGLTVLSCPDIKTALKGETRVLQIIENMQ